MKITKIRAEITVPYVNWSSRDSFTWPLHWDPSKIETKSKASSKKETPKQKLEKPTEKTETKEVKKK